LKPVTQLQVYPYKFCIHVPPFLHKFDVEEHCGTVVAILVVVTVVLEVVVGTVVVVTRVVVAGVTVVVTVDGIGLVLVEVWLGLGVVGGEVIEVVET
jgi:hypothetical protein